MNTAILVNSDKKYTFFKYYQQDNHHTRARTRVMDALIASASKYNTMRTVPKGPTAIAGDSNG